MVAADDDDEADPAWGKDPPTPPPNRGNSSFSCAGADAVADNDAVDSAEVVYMNEVGVSARPRGEVPRGMVIGWPPRGGYSSADSQSDACRRTPVKKLLLAAASAASACVLGLFSE